MNLKHFQKIQEQHKESGLSQKQFCKENDISLATFQYWQKRVWALTAIPESGTFIQLQAPDLSNNPVSFTLTICSPQIRMSSRTRKRGYNSLPS